MNLVRGVILADVDPDEARRRAAEILAGDEFRPPKPSLIERFLNWLGERLADLFSFNIGGGGGGGGPLGTVMTIVLVVALVVGLAFLVRSLVRWWPNRPRRTKDEDEPVLVAIDRTR
ncbi:MAG TPA: hypothetical protein VF855_05450, partial [Acidimicrobiales bacterium]